MISASRCVTAMTGVTDICNTCTLHRANYMWEFADSLGKILGKNSILLYLTQAKGLDFAMFFNKPWVRSWVN